MQREVVLLCREKNGNGKNLRQTIDELVSYARNQEWTIVKIFAETGSLGSLTLWDLRLMAKYKEYDCLLLKDFDTFEMPPDEAMEEVRYLVENGVEVRTIEGKTLTCESLPFIFRSRFKIFAGGKNTIK